MARKKQPKRENTPKMQGFIAGAGEIQAQNINDTLQMCIRDRIKNSTTNDVRKALVRVLDEKLSEATKKNN